MIVLQKTLWGKKHRCGLIILLLLALTPLAASAHVVSHASKPKHKHITKSHHHRSATKHVEHKEYATNLKVPPLEVPEYFYKDKLTAPEPAAISSFLSPPATPSASERWMNKMVGFVRNTVTTLHYSDYKLGGTRFDYAKGIYVLDCSNYVDHILKNVSPHAYNSLVTASGAPTPASQHYYDFFNTLGDEADHYWNKIENVAALRPGDILVFRYKNSRGSETGGHVMVVMDKPVRETNIFFVKVADSAPTRHSQDTRQANEAGIGIGTLLLRVNPETGKPSAFAWNVGSYWNKNVKIAMARPNDMVDTTL